MSRGRKLGRSSKPTKKPKRKITIFTEGANTEPDYLRALKPLTNTRIVDVKIVRGAGDPKNLQVKALAETKSLKRNSYSENDEVWVACDDDGRDHVTTVVEQCEKKGIRVAYSNPCFELWLILHYQEYTKSGDQTSVQLDCEKICQCYSSANGKRVNASELIPLIEQAEQRAIKQYEASPEASGKKTRPFTNFYTLTQSITRT